jgi:hypothetical protein
MTLEGKIEVISLNVGTETYSKSELVLTTDEKYPQSISIEFGGDKSDLIDPYKVGDVVEVSINIGGRKWTNPEGIDKYFNSIKGWKIKRLSEDAPEDNLPF